MRCASGGESEKCVKMNSPSLLILDSILTSHPHPDELCLIH